jgi:hypothetical protein
MRSGSFGFKQVNADRSVRRECTSKGCDRDGVTRLLGITHPILLAPIGSATGGKLAAAVAPRSCKTSSERDQPEESRCGRTGAALCTFIFLLDKFFDGLFLATRPLT